MLPRFFRDRRANILPIFALAIVPVIGFVGAAVDYSRFLSVRTDLQKALDATALMLSKEVKSLTTEQLSEKGKAYFAVQFKHPDAKNVVVTSAMTSDDGNYTIKMSVSADVETTLLRVIGQDDVKIGSSTEVVWGMKRLELVLALDNTGSMANYNRMTELKKATKSLLDTLYKAAKNAGNVKVAIMPFSHIVNIGADKVDATWLDWTDWEDEPAILKNNKPSNWDNIGPGSNCPFSSSSHGFRCTQAPANGSARADQIPSSGSYKGYICPGIDSGSINPRMIGRYYNGCYNSVPTTGDGPPYVHTWIPNAHGTWTGCVRDRAKDDDVKDTTPSAAATTKFQPNQTSYCPTSMIGLSDILTNWTSTDLTASSPASIFGKKVNAMQSLGATNNTIGLAWAWHALTAGEPVTDGSAPKADLDKVIILMTDGNNTLNRWDGNGSDNCAACDERMKLACKNVKDAGVKLYTVRLMEGNATLLENCASKEAGKQYYYNVEQASDLNAAFNRIAKNLASLRIAK